MNLQTDKRLTTVNKTKAAKAGVGRWLGKSPALPAEHRQLIAEIRSAKKEWRRAWNRFEYAHSPEQIDYAVYALGAAEKRYTMLIRQAAAERVSLMNDRTGTLWHDLELSDVPITGGGR